MDSTEATMTAMRNALFAAIAVVLVGCGARMYQDAERNCKTVQPGMTLDDVHRLCSVGPYFSPQAVNVTNTAAGRSAQYVFEYVAGHPPIYVDIDGSTGSVTRVQY
jgi:hypothetical protein